MAYKIQSSFAAGELDPALHERTTIDKYKTGLKTERNWFTGKTGRLISRPGTRLFKQAKIDTNDFILYAPPYTRYLVEMGHLYLRIHDLDAGTQADYASVYTASELNLIHFSSTPDYVYVFCEGHLFQKITLNPASPFPGFDPLPTSLIFPPTPLALTQIVGNVLGGTGYPVDYVFTYVAGGREESLASAIFSNVASCKLPIAVGQENKFTVTINTIPPMLPVTEQATEVRAYRRPTNGNVFGYVGSSRSFTMVGSMRAFVFEDFGVAADYTHYPPDYDADLYVDSIVVGTDLSAAQPIAGTIYQQRLILGGTKNREAIFASRPNLRYNFLTDHPVNSASSLTFKSGTSGSANVLRFADLGGLAAFTTAGVYMNQPGPLTPDNITMIQRGNWVIDPAVPVLRIPGAALFVDSLTNSIVALTFSDEKATFDGQEISIYSDHLFLEKKIVSWAFHDGKNPLVWVVFDDGSLATLTYQNEQLVRSWARSDSDGRFLSVTVYKSVEGISTAYFSVDRNGQKTIEYITDRQVHDIKDFVGMDAAVTFKDDYSALAGGPRFTLVPTVPGDWGGLLTLTSSFAAFTNNPGEGAVGTLWRYFTKDGYAIDLTVTAYTNISTLTVQPSTPFPAAEATSFVGMFRTFTTLTGLEHLEGKAVSVLVDGFVESSPLNVVNPAPNNYIVTGGQITLTSPGAIVHVGLPIAQDIETLDVDTVEQKPTLLESINCKRLNIQFYKSRGAYFGNEFPEDGTNRGMINPEYQVEDPYIPNLVPKAQEPYTRRVQFDIDGSWQSRGRVCIRNVDPLPVEILSIIPDLEIYWR